MINPNAAISVRTIGSENNIVVIVDDFLDSPEGLSTAAQQGDAFLAMPDDYYPGHRKAAPIGYAQALIYFIGAKIVPLLGLAPALSPVAISSAFSLVSYDASQLTPLQSIPHFDTPDDNQLATIHYLCRPPFQGTSFYRHRSSKYERITADRAPSYQASLMRDAAELREAPAGYISGDTELFEKIGSVACRYNRIAFYQSNLLHSGDIDTEYGLSKNPDIGRLTINSFVKLDETG